MLNKILIPLDGSELADAALPHVVALTRINGTTITLLHVLESDEFSSSKMDPVEWHLRKGEAQTYLQNASQRLQQHGVSVETVVLEGGAADRIVAYAQKENMDLVVLSTHGKGGLSGWNVSSVAQKVIQRVRKSTLIIPSHRVTYQTNVEQKVGHRRPESLILPMQYRRILVPLDGSSRAECMLPLAEALASVHGAELLLIHIVTQPEMIQRMPFSDEDKALMRQVVERNKREANRYFEQLERRLSPKVNTRIVESENVEYTLLDLSEKESADLVLLTAHGHTGHNGGAYGRLATSFIEHGSTPLYVHQDLHMDEITPLYAEQMLINLRPKSEQRISPHDYVVN